ncbi:DUF5067 domain-containing protein [Corynebacterium coyleae]|uniref:DUF5067 domain-containing protein n=1 Tax=Corynebacterium coyleae TaxID=53374 RepID=UPI0025516FA4|nr:DUF5067 domain-containing protein [Corynebacterium coyleae]MDK8799842.1 DUF5067 domain-containing protein [Corynebacterium coyleae]
MRKYLSIIVAATLIALPACGISDSGKSASDSVQNSQSQSASSEREAPDYLGTWKQKGADGEEGEDTWLEASITTETIRVDWVMESGADRMLFWSGSFDPEAAAEGTVVSQRDNAAMDPELLASGDDTKEFTFKENSFSFPITIQGEHGTIEMEKNGDTIVTPSNVQNSDSANSFDNGVLETAKVKIAINETRVIPAGETGNEYGTTPVLAVFFDMTNKTDEQLAPVDAIGYFTAIQDNDPNQINELNVGGHPDPETLDSQLEKIKKGGTAPGAIAFELSDTTTPVQLVATDNFGMTEIGRLTIEVSQ